MSTTIYTNDVNDPKCLIYKGIHDLSQVIPQVTSDLIVALRASCELSAYVYLCGLECG
jgi:hypothetical protein